jgi:hypothetical protein
MVKACVLSIIVPAAMHHSSVLNMTTDLLMKATGEYKNNNFWYIYSIIGAPSHIDTIESITLPFLLVQLKIGSFKYIPAKQMVQKNIYII